MRFVAFLKTLVLEISDDLFIRACLVVVPSNSLHTCDRLKDKNVTVVLWEKGGSDMRV